MLFSPFLLHNYVIYIVFQLTVHHVVEYERYGTLISCACIFQPKRHYSIVEIIYGCFEGSFLRILWRHSDLIVPAESVHE